MDYVCQLLDGRTGWPVVLKPLLSGKDRMDYIKDSLVIWQSLCCSHRHGMEK